jgi:uridylate kinase
MSQTYVIKLGGSIVSPSPEKVFDFEYLNKLRHCLEPRITGGDKFFIVLGGGSTMRRYRDLAIAAGLTDQEQLHWIGTTINVLHGEIVRAFWHDIADDGVYKYEDYYNDEPITIKKSIKIGGGGRPGHSGDVDAIRVAQKCQTSVVISLKNIDAVYSADPNIDPQATKIKDMNWQTYLEVIGNPTLHTPGANYPIDPIAANDAKNAGIKVIICSGWDLENLTEIFKVNDFKGTTISDY